MQCGIHKAHDFFCTMDKCVLIVLGDQYRMENASQDVCNSAGGVIGMVTMLTAIGHTFAYDLA